MTNDDMIAKLEAALMASNEADDAEAELEDARAAEDKADQKFQTATHAAKEAGKTLHEAMKAARVTSLVVGNKVYRCDYGGCLLESDALVLTLEAK